MVERCTATYLLAAPPEIKRMLMLVVVMVLWALVNTIILLFKIEQKPDADRVHEAVRRELQDAGS